MTSLHDLFHVRKQQKTKHVVPPTSVLWDVINFLACRGHQHGFIIEQKPVDLHVAQMSQSGFNHWLWQQIEN